MILCSPLYLAFLKQVPILTASSGYLFGLLPGTATCLFSAAVAASLSFVIGRTLLRGYVERVLARSPKFQSIDRAIEKEGFKLMLLLRLSPLFPFALSNYLYGASSIKFLPYFLGTLFGFGEFLCCTRRCLCSIISFFIFLLRSTRNICICLCGPDRKS